ncbi:MAG TPA: glycosyltransferase [Candidatus Acidoferrales bacterium]|nr:glycosyltransferase [Candidatus Acidoferrales bacterium]
MLPPNDPDARPSVSAIVPARNEEENIARCVESLAAQAAILEIIVINDQSTDRTASILTDLVARIPKLKVLETSELPAGWVGKNYAVSLGAAQAQCEWLLFTDADAVHLPGSTNHALQDAAEHSASLVSYSPEQELCEWWERALVPFVFVRLAEKFRYAQINDPFSKAAAANGQYLLIRRDAYDSMGGHSAIAGDVLEDVELARRAKSSGYRIYFAPGKGIARVRMYRTFSAMWQGWVKNLYPLMRDKNGSLTREIVTVFPWLPLLLMAFAPIHWALPVLGLALLAGRHATYAAMLKKNHFRVAGIAYYIPAVALYVCALAVSARRYAKGSVSWKGREYPVGMG